MHDKLQELVTGLEALAKRITEVMPDDRPMTVADGNFHVPGISRVDLIATIRTLIESIETRGKDSIGGNVEGLTDYIARVARLTQQVASQLWSGNCTNAAYAILVTLDALRTASGQWLAPLDAAKLVGELKALRSRVRALEGALNTVEPDMASLSDKVASINDAHQTALDLPADLATLKDARKTIEKHLSESAKDAHILEELRADTGAMHLKLTAHTKAAEEVLAKCELAYSASTSVGLGAAFNERSKSLDQSMYFWVICLLGALLFGGLHGGARLQSLRAAVDGGDVAINLLLALVSLGGAVWFAWVATKQIGQRFRLSEDYAYKASISRAYEGYRAEAHRIDEALEARLLASALTRLDEQPLRLVETESHGSPWHEVLSSDVFKKAMGAVPDFASQVKDFARSRFAAAGPAPKAASPTATADSAQ